MAFCCRIDHLRITGGPTEDWRKDMYQYMLVNGLRSELPCEFEMTEAGEKFVMAVKVVDLRQEITPNGGTPPYHYIGLARFRKKEATESSSSWEDLLDGRTFPFRYEFDRRIGIVYLTEKLTAPQRR